jgi:hypothetical protein
VNGEAWEPVCTPTFSHSAGPWTGRMNASNFRRAFGLAVREQLHSCRMGVNVNTNSTFSRGNGAERMLCCGQFQGAGKEGLQAE